MRVKFPLTCRGVRGRKTAATVALVAMLASPLGGPLFVAPVQAQAQTAPVSQGFILTAGDLRFIYHQVEVAQAHATPQGSLCPTCGTLLGPGPNQVSLFGNPNPQLPIGLRTVDGSFNNLVPGQEFFGASDHLFPRLTTPVFRPAQPMTTAAASTDQPLGTATSYAQLSGIVTDSDPRLVSNLITDQTASNPAAVAANANPCGSGGFVCGGGGTADPVTGSLFVPNITPDFGLSAPFNLMFTFFGQFFDHGLDLVNKGGNGTVIMPLQPDDPLVAGPDKIFGTADDIPADQRFMAMTRATVDANHNGVNQTTPWVDQNQTYTSHPSHQVFLREYALVGGIPTQTGKMLDGSPALCTARPTGDPDDKICNIGNWGEVKAQAATKLGILLVDTDLFNVPLVLTDPYGHFKAGPLRGMPQLVLPGPTPTSPNTFLEGDPAGGGVPVPANAFRTNHQFLNDIAHNADPHPGLTGVRDGLYCDFRGFFVPQSLGPCTTAPGTYDGDVLDAHFATGDGRGNENIALTAMHNVLHAEHNRLRFDIDRQINALLTPAEIAAWKAFDPGSGWDYGERLFQAARLVTEMQYQHLVFEEFARKVQPLVHPFTVYQTSINPAISAEFAHTVYRLGHSMLPEVVARTNADLTPDDQRLFDLFLTPAKFNDGGTAGPLTTAAAIGSLVRGLSQQVANELDEFVVDSVRNTLVGLPLDLPAINIARGRSEGIPSLNKVRKQFFSATQNSTVRPYANWFEFGLNLRHRDSLVNFVAAYGTHPSITGATTMAGKRAAAGTLVTANGAFMFESAATSGLDIVDFWNGGLAERQAAFGGLLGSTFNIVFQQQLEKLQDGDRFYYLHRTDGLNLRTQLEGNSFAELLRRNTDFSGGMDAIFNTADFNFNAADLTGSATIELGNGIQLLTLADGSKLFFDPLHTGKNIVFNGGPGADRFTSDIGDDTLYGNAGNDRLDGNDGNDSIHGGDGDDILFGGAGDDTLKGGPGNDALSAGPGFGADLVLAGSGNDFVVNGPDSTEVFAGPGDDILLDGDAATEGLIGGPGDDWFEGGDGHDANMAGDNGNGFDILAGLDPFGGDDVMDGGPGQDNHNGEGGDDIFIMNEGTNKLFGDYGFDWVTMRGYPFAADIELGLLALPTAPVNFNDLRNRYRFVDGASGWDLNDHIRGSKIIPCDPAAGVVAECLIAAFTNAFGIVVPGMELTAGTPPVAEPTVGVECSTNATCVGQVNFRGGSGAAKIAGLTALMGPAAFNKPLPYMASDMLLGGLGSDVLEGKGGNDLIDGDLWLNVQLRAVLNDGTVKVVNTGRDLIADVFADPQGLNPGNISIIRSIVTPVVPAPDCNGRVPVAGPGGITFVNAATGLAAPAPLNCDTAVFNFPRAEYDTVALANGTVTVAHTRPGVGHLSEGIDTLRNIELLQFTTTDPVTGAITFEFIPPPVFVVTLSVPNVVGATLAAATATLSTATLGSTSTTATSATVPIGNVISQSPAAGTIVASGSNVALVVASGTLAPGVVGSTQAAATTAITAAGMTLGSVTTVNSATPAGIVLSQAPPAGTLVAPGTPMALTVSLGPPLVAVPNVVNLTQAAATTAITGAGLLVGAVTLANSTTVAVGNVISQTPIGGTSVPINSAVALTISNGTPPTLVTTVVRKRAAANLTITSPALIAAANTLLVVTLSADGPSVGENTMVNSITNTGAALTWTRAAQSNVQLGTAEVWWAFAPVARASFTVTAVMNNSVAAMLNVMVYSGANSSIAPGVAVNGASGAPTGTLVTTRGNSFVIGVGTDWDNPRVLTPAAGQVIVNSMAVTPPGDTYWVQRTGSAVPAAGTSVTISDTYPAALTDRWNLALVEIRRP